MGTSLKEIFLDFEMNMTGVKLTGKEAMIFQAFKRSIGLCEKTIHKSLEYDLNNKIFYIKLYETSNMDDIITFSIDDKTYTIMTFASDTKEIVLDTILAEIISDYPLSQINQDAVVIKSNSAIMVNLIDTGNFTIILQSEYDGDFRVDLDQSEVSLIVIGMTKEWYNMQHSKIMLERNNMGTKHFDKDPDRKKQYDGMVERSNYWNLEFLRYRQEFSTFGY